MRSRPFQANFGPGPADPGRNGGVPEDVREKVLEGVLDRVDERYRDAVRTFLDR